MAQPRLMVKVDVVCEQCGHEFSFEQAAAPPSKWIATQTDNGPIYTYQGATMPLDSQLMAKACPECNTIQS